MKYIVTTSYKPSIEIKNKAYRLSKELSVPFVPRKRLKDHLERDQIDFYYVFDKNGQLQIRYGDSVFFFHPSMAKVRLNNLKDGQRDHLIESMKLEGNETILDTTFGLGSEALLIGHFLKDGKVTGLEASEHIYRVVSHGLKNYPYQYKWMEEAATKIELINVDLRKFVREAADDSYDIVYCDPMFEVPQYSSNGLNPMRPFAMYDPISVEDIKEMIRVAKKKLILKTRSTDTFFDKIADDIKFDFVTGGKNSGVIYGVLEKQ